MKIFFCPTMFTNIEEDMKKSLHPNPVSGHQYQKNLLQGITELHERVTVLNVPRIRHYPDYPQIFIKRSPFVWNGEKIGENVGFINLWGINNLTQAITLFKRLNAEIAMCKDERCVLVVFNTYLPQATAFMKLKKRYPNVVLCDAIGDLHGKYGISSGHGILGRFIDVLGLWQDSLAKRFDAYVLLSKYMVEALELQGKPHVIVEGFAPVSSEKHPAQFASGTEVKTIFYAGSVLREYGMAHLLQAFSMIKQSEYRLVIAGEGNATELVSAYAERDLRIRYLGVIPPREVAMWQERATVLVSPRLPHYDYVKASFPSKTMECLASGKPYIAHRLPCDPPEYAAYIQYAAGESDQALRDKLVEICELPQEARDEIGKKGREFILCEKNPKVQCEKIMGMLHEMLKEKA